MKQKYIFFPFSEYFISDSTGQPNPEKHFPKIIYIRIYVYVHTHNVFWVHVDHPILEPNLCVCTVAGGGGRDVSRRMMGNNENFVPQVRLDPVTVLLPTTTAATICYYYSRCATSLQIISATSHSLTAKG
jgi:hypothetical protein